MLLSLHMLHQAACLEELVDEAAWWARPPRDCDSDVYLSMVMVGRNDNYGGTFQSRLAARWLANLKPMVDSYCSNSPGRILM